MIGCQLEERVKGGEKQKPRGDAEEFWGLQVKGEKMEKEENEDEEVEADRGEHVSLPFPVVDSIAKSWSVNNCQTQLNPFLLNVHSSSIYSDSLLNALCGMRNTQRNTGMPRMYYIVQQSCGIVCEC